MRKYFENMKKNLLKRWSEEDYPGGDPRFQLGLVAKDLGVFLGLPVLAVVLAKTVEASMQPSESKDFRRSATSKAELGELRSQIIEFKTSKTNNYVAFRSSRTPGTLVRVRLLNTVETFTNAPVHAQIMDSSLGREFVGATLIGDASSDSANGRVNIVFRFLRHPRNLRASANISARALNLDGTFGVPGSKKEGAFARAAIRSAAEGDPSSGSSSNEGSLKELIARTLASNLIQEFKSDAGIAHSNAQVFVLKPMTEFFVELTDYFPGKK